MSGEFERREGSLFHDPETEDAPAPDRQDEPTPDAEHAPAGGDPPGSFRGWLPPGEAEPRHPAAAPAGWLPPVDAAGPSASWNAPPAAARGQLADFGQRVGAAVLDFFIRLAIALVPGLAGLAIAGEEGLVAGILLGAVAGLAYAPVMLVRWDGQTVGHRAVATRIERRDGTRLSGGGAVVREVLVKSLLIEGGGQFTFFILTALNYLWPLWDARNEALHDKICSTRVVRVAD